MNGCDSCWCSAQPRWSDSPNQAAASHSTWLLGLLQRRPQQARGGRLANKMARVVWAMMTSGEAYRPATAA